MQMQNNRYTNDVDRVDVTNVDVDVDATVDAATDVVDVDAVVAYFRALQIKVCEQLGAFEPVVNFGIDEWQHHDGGGGVTRALTDGEVFEKGGVNFSHVHGAHLPTAARDAHAHLGAQLDDASFEACGVSAVLHPRNPAVPCCHFNARFFQLNTAQPTWWFGGGYDLTPCYAFDEDCIHWHRIAKQTCDRFDDKLYARLKQQCDRYFYLAHRNETRGIGGLFFDDYRQGGFARAFQFVRALGDSFLDAYCPIVQRRAATPYTEAMRDFQAYRRGRYVEFNLVYDRGTLFGLQSGGRIESILMSLPPRAEWRYDWRAASGSAEAKLDAYLKPRDWLRVECGE